MGFALRLASVCDARARGEVSGAGEMQSCSVRHDCCFQKTKKRLGRDARTGRVGGKWSRSRGCTDLAGI